MNDIVFQGRGGQPLTNSVLVAETFDKLHRNIIQTIKKLTAENSAVKNMFVETTYLNEKQQEQPMFIMNRDGFTLLAMGFTGKKALQFKLDYIEAFNKMEQIVKQPQALPSSIDMTVLKQLVEATQVMAAQISQMKLELSKRPQPALPTIPASPILATPAHTSEQRISPRQCKYYTVKQIAKEYNIMPQEFNGFLSRNNIQKWDLQKLRWVLYDDLQGYNLTYTVVYESVDEYDEPREYMVWTPAGYSYLKTYISRNACGENFRVPIHY